MKEKLVSKSIYFSKDNISKIEKKIINNNFSETVRQITLDSIEKDKDKDIIIDSQLEKILRETVIDTMNDVMNETNKQLYKANYMSYMNNLFSSQLICNIIDDSKTAKILFSNARSLAHKKIRNDDFDFNIKEFLDYNMKPKGEKNE
jgi:hypothetical protein